jgi:hypothetical protein
MLRFEENFKKKLTENQKTGRKNRENRRKPAKWKKT